MLEVVLAIVILAMSLVAIGQLMTIGAQQSLTVLEQSRGQQYAQSLLDSAAVGILPLQSVGWTPIESDLEWEYSLEVEDNTLEGLKSVTAMVQLAVQPEFQGAGNQGGNLAGTKPSTVILRRWILDPVVVQDRMVNAALADEVVIEEMIAAEEAAASSAEGSAPAPGGGR